MIAVTQIFGHVTEQVLFHAGNTHCLVSKSGSIFSTGGSAYTPLVCHILQLLLGRAEHRGRGATRLGPGHRVVATHCFYELCCRDGVVFETGVDRTCRSRPESAFLVLFRKQY